MHKPLSKKVTCREVFTTKEIIKTCDLIDPNSEEYWNRLHRAIRELSR